MRSRMQLEFPLRDLITLQTSKADSTLIAGVRRGLGSPWRCKHGQLFRSVLRDRACIAVTVYNSMLKFVLQIEQGIQFTDLSAYSDLTLGMSGWSRCSSVAEPPPSPPLYRNPAMMQGRGRALRDARWTSPAERAVVTIYSWIHSMLPDRTDRAAWRAEELRNK